MGKKLKWPSQSLITAKHHFRFVLFCFLGNKNVIENCHKWSYILMLFFSRREALGNLFYTLFWILWNSVPPACRKSWVSIQIFFTHLHNFGCCSKERHLSKEISSWDALLITLQRYGNAIVEKICVCTYWWIELSFWALLKRQNCARYTRMKKGKCLKSTLIFYCILAKLNQFLDCNSVSNH